MHRVRLALALTILAATGTFVLKGARWHSISARWADQGLMKQARSGACSVLLPDGRVLISGGFDARGPLASAEIFDGSGSFAETAPMYSARAGQVCAALPDGRVLVAGGKSSGDAVINSSEIYDPANDSWSLAGPMMDPRSGATASLLPDGRILVAGGDTGTATSSTLEVFDPALGSFSAIPGALSSPRRNHSAAALKDGRILIAGGNNGSVALDSVDVYDPAAGRIAQTLKMSSPRDGLSATRLLDGTVLFAGGNNGSADLASAELFDPKTSAFSDAPAMQTPRRDHLAFLLPNNNTVLIVGGTSAGEPLATSEQFVPWQNTFKSSDSLSTARSALTGTPLKTRGVMMLAGGKTPLATANATATSMGFATVTTDKADYQPGDFVTITGAGFGANEVVAISIVEVPDLDGDSPINFNVTADASGGFTDASFHINTADLGVSFTLTATGQTSGYTAQTTFTDATHIKNVAAGAQSPSPLTAGNSATYAITVDFNGTGTCTAALSITTALPAGATGSFSPTSVTGGTGNASVNSTLTISTLNTTPGGTTNPVTIRALGTAGDCATPTQDSMTGNAILVVSGSVNTSTTIASSLNPSTYGSSVTFTATVPTAGVPVGGTVTFKDGATVLGTGTLNGSPRQATFTTSTLSAGSHNSITATYAGAPGFLSSTSGALTQTVNQKNLTVSGITANNKIYDSSTSASLNAGGAALVGVVAGDTVTLNTAGATVTFIDKTVGTNKTVTVSGLTIGGTSAGNYSLTQPTTTANISAKTLTVTGISANNKVYDHTTAATLNVASAALVGVVLGDTVTLSTAGATGTFADKNIGTGKTGTIAGLTISGTDAGNYSLTQPTTTADITALALTGSITASNKIYDGTTAATIATRTLAGVIAPDVVTLTGGTATFDTKNAGTGKTVTTTGLTLGGADAGNYTVNSTATTTADIAKLALTVTAATNTKIYDGTTSAAATPTITSGAVQTGDTANFTETYDTKNFGTGKTLTAAGTVTDGNSGNNYSYTFVTNTTGVINKAPLTITAATNTKTYDGTTFAAATPVATGVQTGDSVTATETYDTRNFGSGKTLSVVTHTVNDGNSGGNYTVTLVNNTTGVINKAILTITATTNTKTYDASIIAAAIPTTSGVQTGDTVNGLAETYDTATAGSGKILSVSAYTVNDGNSGANYTVNLVTNNTGVITQATPGVTESGPGTSTYGQSVTVSVTVAPPFGGTPMGNVQFTFVQNSTTKYLCSDGHIDIGPCSVSVTLSGGAYVASVTTNQLPPGMDGITATYSGDTNFTGGSANNVSVTVSQADTATTVTKTTDPSTYGDTVTFTVKVKNNTPNSTGVPTGTVGLSFKVDLLDPNTYYICSDGTIPITPCAPALNINLAPDVLDSTNTTAKATVNTSRLPAGLQAHAFAYAINGLYSGDTNFKPSGPVGLNQTVNQRAITVTAVADTKPYDGNTTSAGLPTITTGTLTNGDTAHFTQTFNNRNANTGKTLTPAGLVNDGFGGNNYAVTYTSVSTGVINARAITVSAVADTKTYDGTTSSSGTPTIAPALISPDSSGFTQSFFNKNMGTGKTLIPTGSVNDGNTGNNYLVTFVNSTSGVINAASLTITAQPNTKTYDATKNALAVPTYSGLQTGDTLTGLVETYADPNAGSGKTLSVTAAYTVSDGNGGHNYNVTLVDDHTGVINTAPLTITAVSNTKTYDSTTSAAAIPTVTGLQGTTDTVTNRTETYDTRHAGTSKVLSVATYTVNDGNSGNNYTVTKIDDHTGVINPAPLTITAVSNSKTYDSTTAATAKPTVAGLQGSDTVTGLAEVYADKNAGNNKTLSVSTYTVNDGNSGGDYTVTKVDDHTGVINKAPLTITALTNTKTYDGNTSAAALPTVTGLQGSDTAVATETYSDKNAGTGKTLSVTAYTITDGNSGGNYTVTPVANTTGIINRAPLTVSATGVNKIYDGNASATVTLSDNRVALDVFTDSYAAAVFPDKNVGTGKTINVSGISISGTDAGNYTFNTTAVTSANITPRALTVTAAGINRVYDGTTVATVNLLDDRVSGDLFTASYTGATFADKNVGTGKVVSVAGISILGTDAANYVLAGTTATTTADITVRPITVSAVTDSKVYDGTTASSATPAVTVGSIAAGDTANFSQTFDTKNVSTGKTLTATGSVTDGNSGNNYAVTFATNTAGIISKRPITVTAAADTKTYDGNTTSGGTPTITTGALATGDTATFTQVFDSKNAVARMLLPSGTITDGNGGNNYTVTYVNTAGTINKRPLIITATGVSRVYDATTIATVTLGDNRVPLDVFTDSYASANFTDKKAGNGKTINVAGITISGPDAPNYTFNYTATATADITAKGITGSITAANKVYDRTTAATLTSRTLVGAIGLDDVQYAGGSATFSDKTVATGKTVTATGLGLSGTDAGNYTVNSTATTTADITALAISGSITAANKVYDGGAAATILRTLAGVISGDNVTYTGGTGTFADKNVGSGKIVTGTGLGLSGTDANNYTVNSSATTTADITKRSLTVTAAGVNKVYDGTTTATVTLSDDRVGGDAVIDSYSAATFADKNVGAGKAVAVNGISISGADAGNYSLSNTTASTSANLTARALTVTATGINKVYDSTTVATVNLSDNRVSGDVFTDSYANAAFADKHVGATKPVSVAGISISGTDFGNYTFNTTASATASITQAPLTITAVTNTKQYDATTTAGATPVVAGLQGSDTVTGRAEVYADKNAGTAKTLAVSAYTVNDGNTGGNYSVSTVANSTGAINKAPLTITALPNTKVYDSTTGALALPTVSGLQGSDTVTGLAEIYDTKNVGTGKTLSVSAYAVNDGTSGANYAVTTPINTTGVIMKATLTVTATGVNRVYDGNMAATVTLSDNHILGDTVIDSYVSASFGDKVVGTGKAVSVAGISISGPDAGNYSANPTAMTTADITAKGITGSITAANKVYDRTSAATITNRSLAGVIAGDVVSYVGGTATFSDKTVAGGKTVTATGLGLSGADAGNYTVNSTATTTANITALGITGNITAANKAYDGSTAAMILTRPLTGVISGDNVTYTGGTATFADKNVGTGKTVTGTGLGLSGTDAGNYTVNSSAMTTADITKATLTISAAGVNKIYDSNNIATVTLSDNRVPGDVFVDSYTSALFATLNTGIAIPVSVTGISISGTDATNYTFNTSATTVANIAAAMTTTVLNSTLSGSTTPATVTLTAKVTNYQTPAAPTGTVTFTDTSTGTVIPGAVTYSTTGSMRQATLTASFAVGTHIVSATYTPDSNFVGSISAATNPAVTITGPSSGFVQAANTNIPFAATFTDSSTATPSAQWAFKSADTTVVNNGIVNGLNISGSFQFAIAGVYGITLTFNDGLGGITISNQVSSLGAPAGLPAYTVVYDPTAGFVTGGGWINSAPNSYVPNPALTGKASFGFVSKYQKGANVPTGETQFNFQVANLDFHSTVYQWLVVSGPMAQYKGSGTINGSGNYTFLLTARDGSLAGGNTPDGFRLKIMDSTGATVIYDNMIGATDDATSNNTQSLGGGSVVVHSK